jgi:Holliday junction resolvase RusA-like endonuclease
MIRKLDNTRLFTITDLPIKPYVRMTQASKHVDPDALFYQANQEELKIRIGQIMAQNGHEMLPGKTPLWVTVDLEVKERLHTKDSDNQLKALFDAMSKIVYPDDRWIDVHAMRRSLGERDLVTIEVGVMVQK